MEAPRSADGDRLVASRECVGAKDFAEEQRAVNLHVDTHCVRVFKRSGFEGLTLRQPLSEFNSHIRAGQESWIYPVGCQVVYCDLCDRRLLRSFDNHLVCCSQSRCINRPLQLGTLHHHVADVDSKRDHRQNDDQRDREENHHLAATPRAVGTKVGQYS